MFELRRRYEPWGLLGQLHDEMDRMFRTRTTDSRGNEAIEYQSDWVPAVDVKEEANQFVIHADVPGVDPKDIEVSTEKGALRISGHRQTEKLDEKDNYRRVERSSGSFLRQFSLPETVNTDGITAKTVNGVLEIIIPKAEKPQAKKITVEG